MSSSFVQDAFAHHAWATLRLLDACEALTPEQLTWPVAGAYGPVLETLRHVVESDAVYLAILKGDESPAIETAEMGLAELHRLMEESGFGWERLLEQRLDADAAIKEVDAGDGYQRWAPPGIRLAQALSHGADHRSQVCSALSGMGFTPPGIDAWHFGLETERVSEALPPG
jgi:uncharacterized damage-inducible protein DinB